MFLTPSSNFIIVLPPYNVRVCLCACVRSYGCTYFTSLIYGLTLKKWRQNIPQYDKNFAFYRKTKSTLSSNEKMSKKMLKSLKKKDERFATNNNKGMQHHCTSVNLNKIFPPAAILATTTIQQCRIANTMERCPPVCCLIEEGVHLREIASVEKIELCTTLARPFCYCCSGLR